MTDTKPPAVMRPQRWRDLRWILAAVIALAIGVLLFGLFGPEPPLRVSPATTRITEPLAADGLPDYQQHVLSLYGPPVAPEQNAAVPLLRAAWPLEIDAADLPAVCKALGIPATPPADPPPLVRLDKDPLVKPVLERFEEAQPRPWRSAEQPEIRGWLDRNERAIDLLVEASRCDRYWLPSPSFLRPAASFMLIGTLLPDIQAVRMVVRPLLYRAMGRAGEGHIDESWQDVLAVHRLSRLLEDQPGFLVTHLVALAVAAQAHDATVELLGLRGLTAEHVRMIRHDLEALRPLDGPMYGESLERLTGTDTIVWLARNPGERAQAFSQVGVVGGGVVPVMPWLYTSLDWNVVTSRVNTHYDQMLAIAALPTHAERADRMEKIQAELSGRVRPVSGWQLAGWMLSGAVNRGERSMQTADSLLALLGPALSSYDAAVARGKALERLLRLAAALQERRLSDDGYPARLEDLVPAVLAELPLDPFTAKPFVYARRGDGCLLYSLGINGVDDGGTDFRGRVVRGEWQETPTTVDWNKSDIVVRMPVPARK